MPLPVMTPEQRAAALAKAAEARSARSAMLAEVKAGTLDLAAVLERTDDITKKTRVVQVLRAIDGVGRARVTTLLIESGVDEKRRVGGLTAAQRTKLLAAVAPQD